MALKFKKDNEQSIDMDLSSMVDIVLLLLIYFLVAASIKQDESELKVAIPIDRENYCPPRTVFRFFVPLC